LLYWQFERFADVVVEVPENSMEAIVTKQKNPAKPSWWRHNRWVYYSGAAALLVVAGRWGSRRSPVLAETEKQAAKRFKEFRLRMQRQILDRERRHKE